MRADSIEIGKTYRMRGRKLDRYVIDIISRPDLDKNGKYLGEYRVALVEIRDGKAKGRQVREYLPWFADDAIMVVTETA